MSTMDFTSRYDTEQAQPASDEELAEEGFLAYTPKGKIWGHELTGEEIAAKFPSGKFIASWGMPMVVEDGDFIAMPFPSGGEVYRIERAAFVKSYAPGGKVPTQAEVIADWEDEVGQDGNIFFKATKIHAKVAEENGSLETVVDGKLETHQRYSKGDFIICGSENERFSMPEQHFIARYELALPEPSHDPELAKEGYMVYRPTGQVWAVELSDDDIKTRFPFGQFIASW